VPEAGQQQDISDPAPDLQHVQALRAAPGTEPNHYSAPRGTQFTCFYWYKSANTDTSSYLEMGNLVELQVLGLDVEDMVSPYPEVLNLLALLAFSSARVLGAWPRRRGYGVALSRGTQFTCFF
jgi:hypothetical protein